MAAGMDAIFNSIFNMGDYDPGIDSIGELLGMVINIAMGIGIAGSVLGIVFSGILFITSKGDYKALPKAKSALTYSVVAFILSVGAVAIKLIIVNLLGITGELSNATPSF
jgi:hypothetical protein